jgi:hypothetical protein
MKLVQSYLEFTQIRVLLTMMLGALSTNSYLLKKENFVSKMEHYLCSVIYVVR